MERIKSFTINHNILKPGFYISRKDGEIVTYDLSLIHISEPTRRS